MNIKQEIAIVHEMSQTLHVMDIMGINYPEALNDLAAKYITLKQQLYETYPTTEETAPTLERYLSTEKI